MSETQPDHYLRFETGIEQFTAFIDGITSLVDESVLLFNEDMVRAVFVDPANVAMGEVVLGAADCEVFESNRPDGEIGVVYNVIRRYFDEIPYADCITFETQPDDKCRIDIEGSTYSIALTQELVDPESIRGTPDTEFVYDNQIRLPIEIIRDVVDKCEYCCDFAELSLLTEGPEFIVGGTGSRGNYECVLAPPETHSGVSIQFTDEQEPSITSRYSLDYLTDVLEAAPSGTKVELSFKHDFPLELRYEFGEESYARFNLSPRLSSGGDEQ